MKIVFLPLPSGKPWNGATIYNEPLGGSEAAVAYMARAFSRLGHHVTVYTHGAPGVFDGVLYQQYVPNVVPQFHPATDVVIVSRWLDMLNALPESNAKHIFWIHDMPTDNLQTMNCHAVFAISVFQATQWRIRGNVFVASDGVDVSLFKPNGPRDSTKLVWAGNPDRGLPIAARVFQELRKRWPDLKLHVFGRSAVYGWGPEAEAPFIPHPQFMENVVMHDPLPRAQLAKELQSAFAYFYPAWWPEVFCMATLEAQACGTPVIAPPIGALPETVHGGILSYDFLNAFSQLRNVNRYNKLSATGVDFAQQYSWENVAEGWLEIFQEMKS